MEHITTIIMRRVYYAYIVRNIMSIEALCILAVFSVVFLIGRFVSFQSVAENILAVRVGDLDTFLYNALVNTEIWTHLLMLIFLIAVFFFIRALRTPRRHTLQFS